MAIYFNQVETANGHVVVYHWSRSGNTQSTTHRRRTGVWATNTGAAVDGKEDGRCFRLVLNATSDEIGRFEVPSRQAFFQYCFAAAFIKDRLVSHEALTSRPHVLYVTDILDELCQLSEQAAG